MEPPIWKTPQFWRDRAAEWRGPRTDHTGFGICYQATVGITESPGSAEWYSTYAHINAFIEQYWPSKLYTSDGYFFPIGDRASRAALCDRIADDLEKQQTQR